MQKPGGPSTSSFVFHLQLKVSGLREAGVLLPNNQRQHRTSHAPENVLPLRICANYCAPCQLFRSEPIHGLLGQVIARKSDVRLSERREFKLPWRKAGLLKSS